MHLKNFFVKKIWTLFRKDRRELELLTNPFSGCQACSEMFCSDLSPGQFRCFNSKRFLSCLKDCK